MKVELLDLKRALAEIETEVESEVRKVFESSKFIMGENVKAFENECETYLHVDHSITVGSGSDALFLALKALDIGAGDEVITTPYTFFATPESIASVGAIPIFVDVRLDNFNIDENKIEERITEKTKAIMPVHIFGHPCAMDKINEIAKKHNLHVIDDAAQAIGAEYQGKKVGGLSDLSCFSFHPTKNLGAVGDGGMITTNDDYLAGYCRALKVHGSGDYGEYIYNIKNNISKSPTAASNHRIYNPNKYHNYLIGYNSRLDEIQAAVLRIKLRNLDKYNARHREIAEYYNDAFKDSDLITPTTVKDCLPAYHQYIVRSNQRDRLMKKLADAGVQTGIYYPLPMNLQKAFKLFNNKVGDCPNAELLSKTTLALPINAYMSDEEVEYVAKTVFDSSK